MCVCVCEEENGGGVLEDDWRMKEMSVVDRIPPENNESCDSSGFFCWGEGRPNKRPGKRERENIIMAAHHRRQGNA